MIDTKIAASPPHETKLAGSAMREIGCGVFAQPDAPVRPEARHLLASKIGRKGAGLSLLPPRWTPPFCLVAAEVFSNWRHSAKSEAVEIIRAASDVAANAAQGWSTDWKKGITVRSSATEETLRERGANRSIELAADFDQPMVARAITAIFEHFVDSGAEGAMAVVIQGRVANLALGHMSNERRVSKTVNHWMWEHEVGGDQCGRFNSQRESPAEAAAPLKVALGQRKSLLAKFRSIGRWCTLLGAGRVHLEWGATTDRIWIFQLDFEDDQPDVGVDPTELLRGGDFMPSGNLSASSAFSYAPRDGSSGWSKLDKVRDFLTDDEQVYPTLIYITGTDFVAALRRGENLAEDLDSFGHGRIVCRTDCRAAGVSKLNLPRTQTVSSVEAVQFIKEVITKKNSEGVASHDLCFVLHKFIPAVSAAWAVVRAGEQIVRIDSLWGLPDGLQYLPHDSFEYDVRRDELSTERLRYKHAFLQETEKGDWKVIKVARRATRWRSLSSAAIADVARRTHEIARRLGKDLQIMWFCQVPDEVKVGANIPWFSMPPSEVTSSKRVSPGKRRFAIRSLGDLDDAEKLLPSLYLLQIDPDEPDLFRDDTFIDRVVDVAKSHDFPVGLTGSILAHAFYLLEKSGVTVVASDEPTRSRTRHRRVFKKIVRDDLPERITEGGETVTLAEIAKGEARAALIVKLLEESYELLAADTPQEVTAELADMLEVVRALAGTTGVDWEAVLEAAENKRGVRGGFEKNIVLLETSWPGWLEGKKASSVFTIPLAELGQITSDAVSATISYPLLLAQGSAPRVRLPGGTEVSVTMSGEGVRLLVGGLHPNADEQLKLDL